MTDDDKIEDIISEIAQKHRLVVGRDDPILILQTINNRLLQNGQKTQQEMLEQHKEELEAIAMRWSEDAKDKAERIVNASLAASKKAMATMMTAGAQETIQTVRTEINPLLTAINGTVRNARKIAMLNIITASLAIIAAAIVLWAAMLV